MLRGIYKHKPLSEETKRKIGFASKGNQCAKGNPPNKTSFKKGQHYSPATEFKKGNIPANWSGQYNNKGYIYILKPDHPFATKQGYVRRSRLVMEKKLGRYLTPKEIVHHRGTKYPIDSIENKSDDRIKNLKLFENKSKHTSFHITLHNPNPRSSIK